MLKVIFLQGLPASGKSTWAKQYVLDQPANSVKRINKDGLRAMLDIGRYSKGNEQFVLEVRDYLIYESLRHGSHVIVDDTNFEEKHKKRVLEIIESLRIDTGLMAQLEVKRFNIDPVEAIKRNELRPEGERVPTKVIWDMYNRYIKPTEYAPVKKAEQDISLPKAIICDLDGTLARHQGRSPYDWEKADTDVLDETIANVLWAYEEKGYQLIFMSGRNNEAYEISRDWLILNGFRDFILHVREPGDNRKDSVVKKEMYDDVVKDKFYIEFVLDDRDQVVDMWRRELGLKCLQVNYGNF